MKFWEDDSFWFVLIGSDVCAALYSLHVSRHITLSITFSHTISDEMTWVYDIDRTSDLQLYSEDRLETYHSRVKIAKSK